MVAPRRRRLIPPMPATTVLSRSVVSSEVPASTIARPGRSALPSARTVSRSTVTATVVRSSIAGDVGDPMTVKSSSVTKALLVTWKPAPRAMTTVRRPCPRMRTEEAASTNGLVEW